ncbi:hypothetical protein Dimus_015387 [Dionaea muscipula]
MGIDEKLKVEEGEISDQDSIEEISKDVFKASKQHKATKKTTTSLKIAATPTSTSNTNTTTTTVSADSASGNRYWMRDPYNYSYPGGYAGSGLYNLAWAQAVQNKPLTDVLVELKPADERNASANSANASPTRDGGGKSSADEPVVIDSEKEEGELEDGEINFDMTEQMESDEKEGISRGGFEIESDDGELEKEVDWIRQVIEKVTPAEAEKSFEMVCHRLRLSLERLGQLVMHCWFPSKDALIGQTFSAIQCVCSVFNSMSPMLKEQNKAAISRLISYVLNVNPTLFSTEQIKEVKAVMVFINPPAIGKQEELPITEKAILTDCNTLAVSIGHNLISSEKVDLDSGFGLGGKKVENMLYGALRPLRTSNSRARVSVGPLLDLHKVHDEDTLPSPTHKSMVSQILPVGDVRTTDSSAIRLGNQAGNVVIHPYETEALKAVSSYQQKFSRTTFSSYDRLPSPTPSGEGKNGEAEDAGEEVSSSSKLGKINAAPLPNLSRPIVSSALNVSCSIVPGVIKSSNAGNVATVSNPTFRAAPKSRDPRLRFMNSDIKNGPLPGLPTSGSKLEPLPELLSSKKHKGPEVPAVDVPVLKKQRNDLETTHTPNGIQTSRVSQGLGNAGSMAPEIVSRVQLGAVITEPQKIETGYVGSGVGSINPGMTVGGISHPASTTSSSMALHSILSTLTGNSAAWVNVLREQNKSSDPATAPLHSGTSSSFPLISTSGEKIIGFTPMLSQAAVSDVPAKIRMKPRDPRRMLQNYAVQKNGSSGVEHSALAEVYTGTTQGVRENQNLPDLVNGAATSRALSQSAILPDIAKPFTESLKNIADIISLSPTSVVSPITAQNPLPQGTELNSGSVTSGEQPNSSKPQTSTSLNFGAGASPAQPQGLWGDVEHLFDGYDEEQKAAIQRERARRIEEQKKMFAARKLCLVLDLDHTLLNSAKFSEVDPVHDEILRKKEEQDREKLQRHLFRFPHMGMWTKLRPGIWTFLEKASKLYELHLYTMGNKLYATEMAKVLDPTGVLFAGRVISRGDDGDLFDGDERVPKSKDLDGVLGMESAVVIIDDSVRVWPHNKLNLIIVERYTYFPCSRRQFGLAGPSLLEIDHDERPEDGTLASSLAVIERLHNNFFSNQSLDEVDVRNILASEQRKILAGCRIVFSRMFPVGEAKPHLHPLWQTAEQFGAVCTNKIDEQVTHVVANSLGTDKVNWALSTGRHVVHAGWVEASALLYRRAKEEDFAIKP